MNRITVVTTMYRFTQKPKPSTVSRLRNFLCRIWPQATPSTARCYGRPRPPSTEAAQPISRAPMGRRTSPPATAPA